MQKPILLYTRAQLLLMTLGSPVTIAFCWWVCILGGFAGAAYNGSFPVLFFARLSAGKENNSGRLYLGDHL